MALAGLEGSASAVLGVREIRRCPMSGLPISRCVRFGVLCAVVTACALGASSRAFAGSNTWIFGTNLGVTASSGTVMVGIPHGALDFGRPGLRTGVALAGGRNEFYADYGLFLVAVSGSHQHALAATLNYQQNLSRSDSHGGYLTAGAGILSYSSGTGTLFGVGAGKRTWLRNGYAAIRVEGRIDRAVLHSQGTNLYGLKFGVDVKLN
jgi:hypothetical protein